MSQNHKPEALILANDRPSAGGDDLYQWALDAEGMIRRLQARVEDLEDNITALTTWKKEGSLEVRGWEVMVEQERRIVELEAEAVEASHRLAVAHLRADQMESQHKQAAEIATAATKELAAKSEIIQELEAMLESIGAGGVSAQRIRQESDHIAQDSKMVAAQEPFGYFKAEPFGWRDCAETDEGAIALYEAPQPQADARDAERWGSEPVTGTPFLQEEDQHLLDRFIETTEDNEGFDIGKEAIKRLANLGVVESLGFGRYGVTVFGYWVHEHYWYQNPSLPLKTNLDRDADARAAIYDKLCEQIKSLIEEH